MLVVEVKVREEKMTMEVTCLPCGRGVGNTWRMIAGNKVGGTEWLVKASFVT